MNVLVIHAHPSGNSFSAALCDSILRGLNSSNHDVRVRRLYEESFDPRLSVAEWRGHMDPPETKTHLASHFDDLRWCEALILVYPTWWGAQPAILKGWMDRVWANGVAWDLPDGASRLRPLLHNVRRIITVTTHGSNRRVNALQGVPGRRISNRSLRVICHPRCRTKWLAIYRLDSTTDSKRRAFLKRVEKYGASL
jgi:putative NADPH-quinone reductase